MNTNKNSHIYKLAILGAGPAGVAASIYAARKEIDTILISDVIGGQSTESPSIHNWIGDISLSGIELAKKFQTHLESYENSSLKIYKKRANSIHDTGTHFEIHTESEVTQAEYILYALGSVRRKLDIPGSLEFEGRGVVYCASCDGPLFKGKPVAVVGGGNAAFESALQLAAYCPTVYLINRSNEFRADEVTVSAARKNAAIKILTNTTPLSLEGTMLVESLSVKNEQSENQVLPISGLFVEIGQLPNTELLRDMATITSYNTVEIDPWTQRTSHPRIWSAGDCTNILYHQNNIAAGDGVKAIENIYQVIHQ